MKKLKLNLDEIKVESFETKNEIKESKGTVIAQQEPQTGFYTECADWATCVAAGCGGTWYQSCQGATVCFIGC